MSDRSAHRAPGQPPARLVTAEAPLEVVVLQFDDLPVETARAVATRMAATDQVRIVSAAVISQDLRGVPAVDEWLQFRDVFDLTADLAARRALAVDQFSATDLAAELVPGTTLLLLVVEHTWAQPLYADVLTLGGRCLASELLPVERIRAEERRICLGGDVK
jgi:hypothetical protein